MKLHFGNSKTDVFAIGFGQDFLAKHLLGWPTDGAAHDAVGDAIKSLRLYRLHQQLSADGDRLTQTQARELASLQGHTGSWTAAEEPIAGAQVSRCV